MHIIHHIHPCMHVKYICTDAWSVSLVILSFVIQLHHFSVQFIGGQVDSGSTGVPRRGRSWQDAAWDDRCRCSGRLRRSNRCGSRSHSCCFSRCRTIRSTWPLRHTEHPSSLPSVTIVRSDFLALHCLMQTTGIME